MHKQESVRDIRLLIIDDEIDDGNDPRRNVYTKSFENFKCEYISTIDEYKEYWKNNGKANSFIPDAFVVDENLVLWKSHNIDNILGDIKKYYPKTPIIMISKGYSYNGHIENSIRSTTNNIIEQLNYSEILLKYETNDYLNELTSVIRSKILKYYNWQDETKYNNKIIILHLSDLQFNDSKSDKRALVIENTITRYLKEEDKIPDIVVVTGDLTSKFTSKGYEQFCDALKHILDAFYLDSNNLLLVPGNHDYDRSIAGVVNVDELYKRFPFFKYCNLSYNLTGYNEFMTFSNDLNFIVDRFSLMNLKFILLNTNCSNMFERQRNYSILDSNIENLIIGSTSKINRDDFVIGLGHVPLPFIRDCTDFTEKDYEEHLEIIPPSISRLIDETRTRVYLSGHVHETKFKQREFEETLFESNVSSATLEKELLNGDKKRGFNLIEIEYSDSKPQKVIGSSYYFGKKGVQKWSVNSDEYGFELVKINGKWKKSKK